MRQIKFRAWDTEKQQFFYTGDGHGFEFCLSPIGGNYVSTLKGETLLDSDIPWQQFTGILDKNGKEIYEGDILGNGVVVWTKQSCAFFVEGEDFKHTVNFIAKDHEIIGNLYENPELLK